MIAMESTAAQLEYDFEGFEADYGVVQGDHERFTIDNDDKADWAVERILQEEAEADRFCGVIDRKIAMLEAQKEAEHARAAGKTSFLRAMLEDYMRHVAGRETKTKKVHRLPSGNLVWKKPTLEYVHDDDAIIAYCKENAPEFVETKDILKWGELKKRLDMVEIEPEGEATAQTVDAVLAATPPQYKAVDTVTGEFVMGITIAEKPGAFSIKAAKGA